MKQTIFFTIIIFSLGEIFAQLPDAELMKQTTDIVVKNGELLKTHYYEIKINNRKGEKFATVSIPFSKLTKVRKLKAWIKDENGKTLKKLKKGNIIERSAISDISLYEDQYIKEFTLLHTQYPYRLVYTYQSREKQYLYLDYWIPVIDSRMPTWEAVLNLTLPQDLALHFSGKHIDDPTVWQTENGFKRYVWKTNYAGNLKSEVFSPPLHHYLPSVVLVPGNFSFDKEGSFENWNAYGMWQHEIMEGLQVLPASEIGKLEQLTKDLTDTLEIIQHLYHYLQDETRYVNVSIETGGMKPYPAKYVSENKYGDCKALTNYFMALLSKKSIKSYYTKVYAGDKIHEIDKNFPSQQFNHVILCIPLSNDTIWLDCTSEGAFNYLGTFTQNRNVLLVDQNKSVFVRTPSLKPAEVLESRTIRISEKGQNANIHFTNIYRGRMYEALLSLGQNFNNSEQQRIFRNYIIEPGHQLINHQINRINRDSAFIEVSYSSTYNQLYQQYANEILVKNIPFPTFVDQKPSDRQLPLQINYPINKTDTIYYQIPAGMKLNTNPPGIEMKSKYGKYSMEFEKSGNTIRVVKSILIFEGQYPLEEYKDFYTYLKQVNNNENKTYIIFEKVTK